MKAIEFCLKNQDEIEICLKDLLGKWVIVYFYPKDNTPGCSVEAIEFSQLKNEFEKHNAIIMGISPDNCFSHKKFIEKKLLSITLLCDTTKEIFKKYKAWGKKKIFNKEYEGVIRTTYLINPLGEIVFAWNKVKAKGHAEKVLQKLKELS